MPVACPARRGVACSSVAPRPAEGNCRWGCGRHECGQPKPGLGTTSDGNSQVVPFGPVACCRKLLRVPALCAVVRHAASAAFLWLNGSLASRFSSRARHAQPAAFDWQSVRGYTLSELLRLMPRHVRWPLIALAAGGILATLVAAIEMSNWDVFLRFFYHVSYGRNDPVYGKEIGFYLFSLPAYIVLKNWLLLTLVASVVSAGACIGSAATSISASSAPRFPRQSSRTAPLCWACSSW
jgi:hypothetical protein